MTMTSKEQLDYLDNALKEMDYALKIYMSGGTDAIYFYYAAQKKAEEVIETAIALNQDLLYERANHMTKSYHDSFTDLEKLKILPIEELKKLAATAGFRNRLAHEYAKLDPQITVNSMGHLQKIYPLYLKAMKEYLTK